LYWKHQACTEVLNKLICYMGGTSMSSDGLPDAGAPVGAGLFIAPESES
jgi:hypothetical protein